jgi:hypothetical protein
MDFDELLARLEQKISEGRTNPIGYGGGDLTGLSLIEADVMRSPCRALRWLDDNSAYTFQTFVDLSSVEGWQGIRIYNKDGSLYREIKVKMGGGENADPMRQIYLNNKTIITEALTFISEQIENQE